MPDETLARQAHLYPAERGDACDVSRCGRPARVRVGWAMAGDLPTRTTPYCARHAEPWTGRMGDDRNLRAPRAHPDEDTSQDPGHQDSLF